MWRQARRWVDMRSGGGCSSSWWRISRSGCDRMASAWEAPRSAARWQGRVRLTCPWSDSPTTSGWLSTEIPVFIGNKRIAFEIYIIPWILRIRGVGLLSAPLRSNGGRLCFATVYFFIYFFYSPFVLRNYSTDSHQIFRNRVFWSSLNNPVVLKFFWRYLAEKNAKNSENLVKIHGLTDF